jgi:D-amino-acid oxidase
LAIGEIRRIHTGLRPYRSEVRLERDASDPRIIHNYGHGGAGFTMCRGCAEDVVALL